MVAKIMDLPDVYDLVPNRSVMRTAHSRHAARRRLRKYRLLLQEKMVIAADELKRRFDDKMMRVILYGEDQ